MYLRYSALSRHFEPSGSIRAAPGEVVLPLDHGNPIVAIVRVNGDRTILRRRLDGFESRAAPAGTAVSRIRYTCEVPIPLPIDDHVPAIVDAVRRRRFVVVVAPPGAGKTTRVPPALLDFGPVILLQPRRIAARAIAHQIAQENGFAVGEEVGWQVRFERRFGPRTRLLVATEGILTARLQADPLLSEFSVAVLDEFHERSLHVDLALAFVRQAAFARDDLRIVIMSATLDAAPVAAFLGGCPVIEAPGRPYPVDVSHAPGMTPSAAILEVLRRETGHVLAFLPGAPEIRRLEENLRASPLPGLPSIVLPLHGSLDADAQDAALAPSSMRKVILATNLAETSLTVPGVTDVVDSGLHKVLRFDPALGLDRLETERISRDSAEQRAGRAGRTGPGRAIRLWDPRDALRERREPEIERVDLAGPFLEVLAWGADPRRFEWFEPPPPERADAALALLESLGAIANGRITPLGDTLRRLPLHPRLGRVLVGAGGSRQAAAACAILAEGRAAGAPASHATDSDVLSRADAIREAPRAVLLAAEQIASIAARILGSHNTGVASEHSEARLRRALLAGYPDRVARRREPGSPRLLLSSGHGAVLARESGVRGGEWMVAVDVQAASRVGESEALVRTASLVDRSWLEPTRRSVDHVWDETALAVRAFERAWYGAIVLSENAVRPDPIEAGRILAEIVRARGFGDEERTLLRRLRFAGIPWRQDEWIARACAGRASLGELDLPGAIPRAIRDDLDRLAPESIPVPSGRRARIEYGEDGTVAARVKLQELFGLADTPRVGPRREPVTLALLAPNGRPVQTTRDLRSFWERIYPEIRRELRGRYPKHPWPEDPWTASPTHRTKRRAT